MVLRWQIVANVALVVGFPARWTSPLVVVLSASVRLALAVSCGVRWNIGPLSVLFHLVLSGWSDFSLDRRVVAEQERLHSEARKAEAVAAEAMARAARCRKQLDFLEGRDRRILRSELECLELLDRLGAQVPEPPPVASPSSFSDALGTFDWSSLGPLDAAESNP